MNQVGNNRLRILYINCSVYDYLTATLIEGLTDLGHEVACSYDSNYGRAVKEASIHAFAEAADLIVIGTNRGVDHYLLEQVTNPRIVAVDGSDQASFVVSPVPRVKAVFKRELCAAEIHPENNFIYPLPFAAERRYFTDRQEKDLSVSFVANMDTNPLRNSIHVRLLNRKDPHIFSGSTNERTYSWGSPRANAIKTTRYRELLARSRISVNVPGAGYDCARYWEILAARAMLFTYRPDIVIPNDFTDGVNCATFSSMTEFQEKLNYYLSNPDRVDAITEAGYKHLLAYHTSARRAAYFLSLALPAASRTSSCERFHSRDPGRLNLIARVVGNRNAWRARYILTNSVRSCLGMLS